MLIRPSLLTAHPLVRVVVAIFIAASALVAVFPAPAPILAETTSKSQITATVESVTMVETTAIVTLRISESEPITGFDNWLETGDTVTGKVLDYEFVQNTVRTGREIVAIAAYEGSGTNASWFFYNIRRSNQPPPELELTPGFSAVVTALALASVIALVFFEVRIRRQR